MTTSTGATPEHDNTDAPEDNTDTTPDHDNTDAPEDNTDAPGHRHDVPVRRLRDAVRRLAVLTRDRVPTGRGHDDAPDDEGTAATDDAVGFDPLPLLAAFDEAGAVVVAIGQVAGILHGSVELTGDLDVLWDGDPARAPALAEAFRAAAVTVTDDDGRILYDPGATADTASLGSLVEALARLPKVQFRSATASGDCCTPHLPWGDLDVASFLARERTARTAQGRTIRYLDRADLIAMRRAVARPRDLRRAAELERLPPG